MNTRRLVRCLSALAGTAAVASAGACSRAVVAGDHPSPDVVRDARQLVVVTTPGWDSTSGTLAWYSRDDGTGGWRAERRGVPVVVGRTGLAWGIGFESYAGAGDPVKHEGDGRSPAGAFPLDTVFGFAGRDIMSWVRLPYVPLDQGSDCVDDVTSTHYNTVVNRQAVPRVDWNSAEHMRAIDQYRLGVIVGYNAAPPRAGRGSCIFLHIWAGPGSTTAGCTAMDAGVLEQLVRWLDRPRRPALVQLTEAEYERLRGGWGLP